MNTEAVGVCVACGAKMTTEEKHFCNGPLAGTLRDEFAIAFLAGRHISVYKREEQDDYAELAYQMADAMLRARGK